MAPIQDSSSPCRTRSTSSPRAWPSSMAPSGTIESATPWGRSGPLRFFLRSFDPSEADTASTLRQALENKPPGAGDVCHRHFSPCDPSDAVICKKCFIMGRWPVFDLLAIDIEVNQTVRPIDLSDRTGRDQDPLSGPPVPGIDGNAPDVPVGIIHEEILDMTYLAVGGMDMVPG